MNSKNHTSRLPACFNECPLHQQNQLKWILLENQNKNRSLDKLIFICNDCVESTNLPNPLLLSVQAIVNSSSEEIFDNWPMIDEDIITYLKKSIFDAQVELSQLYSSMSNLINNSDEKLLLQNKANFLQNSLDSLISEYNSSARKQELKEILLDSHQTLEEKSSCIQNIIANVISKSTAIKINILQALTEFQMNISTSHTEKQEDKMNERKEDNTKIISQEEQMTLETIVPKFNHPDLLPDISAKCIRKQEELESNSISSIDQTFNQKQSNGILNLSVVGQYGTINEEKSNIYGSNIAQMKNISSIILTINFNSMSDTMLGFFMAGIAEQRDNLTKFSFQLKEQIIKEGLVYLAACLSKLNKLTELSLDLSCPSANSEDVGQLALSIAGMTDLTHLRLHVEGSKICNKGVRYLKESLHLLKKLTVLDIHFFFLQMSTQGAIESTPSLLHMTQLETLKLNLYNGQQMKQISVDLPGLLNLRSLTLQLKKYVKCGHNITQQDLIGMLTSISQMKSLIELNISVKGMIINEESNDRIRMIIASMNPLTKEVKFKQKTY